MNLFDFLVNLVWPIVVLVVLYMGYHSDPEIQQMKRDEKEGLEWMRKASKVNNRRYRL